MTTMYDQEQHLLLADQAHKRRIDSETAEYQEYLDRLRSYQYDPFREDDRLELFQVEMPEWPPVKRSPLQMMFGVDLGGGSSPPMDPFEEKPWRGTQWAVERNFWTQRGTAELAKEMVPLAENDQPERMAYQWQCGIFDPTKHVVIRYWLKEHGCDIVQFFREFLPAHPELEIIETTNPKLQDEKAQGGSYAPTRRCIPVAQLPILAQGFGKTIPATTDGTPRQEVSPLTGFTLIEVDSQLPVATLLPGMTVELQPDRAYAIRADYNPQHMIGSVSMDLSGQKAVARIENIAPYSLYGDENKRLYGARLPAGRYTLRATAHMQRKAQGDALGSHVVEFTVAERAAKDVEFAPATMREREQPGPTSVIWEGIKPYSPNMVAQALRAALGRDFDLFGGQMSDSKIVAMRLAAVLDFLKEDDTDRMTYVLDRGKRNYDCENFSEKVRNALSTKYGLNSCGIIWGNVHAWVFFVVIDGDTLRIFFVDPQDGDNVEVQEFSGQYAISKRCAIYL